MMHTEDYAQFEEQILSRHNQRVNRTNASIWHQEKGHGRFAPVWHKMYDTKVCRPCWVRLYHDPNLPLHVTWLDPWTRIKTRRRSDPEYRPMSTRIYICAWDNE